MQKFLKIYFFNDGPRQFNSEDTIARDKIISIINNIDWDCEVVMNFQDTNLGCGLGPVSAINWAFQNEDRLIILEDDTVPSINFFPYCNYLLEKYKNEDRVYMISGSNPSEHNNFTDDSYLFFSKYGHIWGWATWKRAWNKYDYEMKDWPLFNSTNQISNVFYTAKEQKYFR